MLVDELECIQFANEHDIAAPTIEPESQENALDAFESAEEEPDVDPIEDIIDYLVHCSRGAFPCARVGEVEPSVAQNTEIARNVYQKSVCGFLTRFGKHLVLGHLEYFEKCVPACEREAAVRLISHLKQYHSEEGKQKRIKNRRYHALQELCKKTDYFSEREMMYRNPLLYEQLVGQFLTDDEISERDGADAEGLTFVNMILDTVDRNHMRQKKNEQVLCENMSTANISDTEIKIKQNDLKVASHWGEFDESSSSKKESTSRWGEFERPDTTPSFKPDVRKQSMISAPERELFRKEFLHEMYGDFIEGRDTNFDYDSVDDNEIFDDLQIIDRDKEEEYFDSEPVENDNLEETMRLTHEYSRKESVDGEDELEVFMQHLNKRNEN